MGDYNFYPPRVYTIYKYDGDGNPYTVRVETAQPIFIAKTYNTMRGDKDENGNILFPRQLNT